jgi:beta-mannosidase
MEVTIPENVSKMVVCFTEEELLGGYSANEAVICLSSLNEKAQRNVYYFRDHKDLVLPESPLVVEVDAKEQKVTVHSERLARMVKLEVPLEKITFSENFVDILPGETITIEIGHLENRPVDLSELSVTAINSVE